MNVIMFEMPEDLALQPAWLDAQLMGLHLGQLVEELKTLNYESPAPAPDLNSVLGEQRSALLQQGTAALSRQQFRMLLSLPSLLLPLQQLILEQGGAYWDGIEQTPESKLIVDRVTQRTLERLNNQVSDAPGIAAEKVELSKPTASLSSKSFWLSLAIAAGLLVAVGLWQSNTSGKGSWGFDQPGLLTANVTAREYLSQLADAAHAWHNKRPDGASALEKRLREFRSGCQTLINAPHPQLSAQDKQWLVTNCRLWAAQIDALATTVAQQPDKFDETQQAADQLIGELEQAIRDRAISLG